VICFAKSSFPDLSNFFDCPSVTEEVKNLSLNNSKDPEKITRALFLAWRAVTKEIFFPDTKRSFTAFEGLLEQADDDPVRRGKRSSESSSIS